MLIQSFGYGSIPLKVSSWCCSPFHDLHWFVLSEKRRGNWAPTHLEIADRFVLPPFIAFFSSRSGRLLGFGAASKIWSPETGFGCSLILAAPCFSPTVFASPFCSLFLGRCISPYYRSAFKFQRSSKAVSGFFFLAMENWLMGGETFWRAPQGEGNPV